MAQPSEDKPRPVTDPLALHAMAHPLRLKLIGLVDINGTLTATQAAAALDSTPAVAACHLRALAEYGFVGDTGSGAAVAADRSGRLGSPGTTMIRPAG